MVAGELGRESLFVFITVEDVDEGDEPPLAHALLEDIIPSGHDIHTSTTLAGLLETLRDEGGNVLIIDAENEKFDLEAFLRLIAQPNSWPKGLCPEPYIATICTENTHPDIRELLLASGIDAYERTNLRPLGRRVYAYVEDTPLVIVIDPAEDSAVRTALGHESAGDGTGQHAAFFESLEGVCDEACLTGGNVVVLNTAGHDDDELLIEYEMLRRGIEGLDPDIPIIFVDKDGHGPEWLDLSNPANKVVTPDPEGLLEAVAACFVPRR